MATSKEPLPLLERRFPEPPLQATTILAPLKFLPPFLPYPLLFPTLERGFSIPRSPHPSYELPSFPLSPYDLLNLPPPFMAPTIYLQFGIRYWFQVWQSVVVRVGYWLCGNPSPSESAYDANSESEVSSEVPHPNLTGDHTKMSTM